MGSTQFAIILRAEARQTRAFGRHSAAVSALIAGIDPAFRHTYGRNAQAAEEAWRTIEPLTRGRFKGSAQEVHDALAAAGKLRKITLRAAFAMVAHDYIDREAYDLLVAPFRTLGAQVAA